MGNEIATLNTTLFRSALGELFSTWDAMIDGAEPELLQSLARGYGMCSSTVLMAGISKERGPEIYIFDNDAPLPSHISQAEKDASPHYSAPYNLVKLPDVIMSPPVPAETVIAANFEGIDVDADPETVVWSMRKHLAMQRAMPLPDGIGGIGGFAELTTLSMGGISQRIVDRWPGDKVGAPLRHDPIDWSAWHADNHRPGAGRLKRVR